MFAIRPGNRGRGRTDHWIRQLARSCGGECQRDVFQQYVGIRRTLLGQRRQNVSRGSEERNFEGVHHYARWGDLERSDTSRLRRGGGSAIAVACHSGRVGFSSLFLSYNYNKNYNYL